MMNGTKPAAAEYRRNTVFASVRKARQGGEAGVKTAISAVGGAILGASIVGGVIGALIGGAVGLGAFYAARSLDMQSAKKRNGSGKNLAST